MVAFVSKISMFASAFRAAGLVCIIGTIIIAGVRVTVAVAAYELNAWIKGAIEFALRTAPEVNERAAQTA